MTQNDIINTVMKNRGIKRSNVAEAMGVTTRQQLYYQMSNMTIKTNDIIELLTKYDYRLVLEDKKTGELVRIIEDFDCPNINKMVCGVFRNTKYCAPIAKKDSEEGLKVLFLDPKDNTYLLGTYGKDGQNTLKKVKSEAAEVLKSENEIM